MRPQESLGLRMRTHSVSVDVDEVCGMFGDGVEEGEKRPESVTITRRKKRDEQVDAFDPLPFLFHL